MIYLLDICETAYARPFTKNDACIMYPFKTQESLLKVLAYWMTVDFSSTYRIHSVSEEFHKEELATDALQNTIRVEAATMNGRAMDQEDIYTIKRIQFKQEMDIV